MNPTSALRMLRPMIASSDACPIKCEGICVEVRQGLSRLAFAGHYCATNHCPFCILVQLGLSRVCPWHSKNKFDPHSCLHLVCELDNSGQGLVATGQIGHPNGRVSIVLCHVIQKVDDVNSVHGVSEWERHFHLDWVLPLLPDVEPKQLQCWIILRADGTFSLDNQTRPGGLVC